MVSNREVTILRYMVSGLYNKEIADKLLRSNKTVSAHESNIYGKLGLHSIVELIDYAKLYRINIILIIIDHKYRIRFRHTWPNTAG